MSYWKNYADYFSCPKCEEDLEVNPDLDRVTCPECDTTWDVDRDYSFEEGRWRNLSHLVEVKNAG